MRYKEKVQNKVKNIKIIEQYTTEELSDGDFVFETEKNWESRPAWIRIIKQNRPIGRFARIQIPKTGEILYRAFGRYFIPYDYTNAEEQLFMDAMAGEYDQMVADQFNAPMAKALISQLPLKKIDETAHILDMGCGTGILTELLIKEGFLKLTLVDFSKEMLIQAEKKLRNHKTINYESLDVTKKLPKGKFDLVLSVMLFNTFDDKTTDKILSRLVKQMPRNALFGVLEDSKKPAYTKYFDPLLDKVFNVGLREKYIFVGIKK